MGFAPLNVVELLGLSGHLWGLSGSLWACLGLSGSLLVSLGFLLGFSGHLWASPGPLWASLGIFGSLWVSLGFSGVSPGPLRASLGLSGAGVSCKEFPRGFASPKKYKKKQTQLLANPHRRGGKLLPERVSAVKNIDVRVPRKFSPGSPLGPLRSKTKTA